LTVVEKKVSGALPWLEATDRTVPLTDSGWSRPACTAPVWSTTWTHSPGVVERQKLLMIGAPSSEASAPVTPLLRLASTEPTSEL
jgi:hypothetical protein